MGAGGDLAQDCLQFRECVLDWIEVRRTGRQEPPFGAAGLDGVAHGLWLPRLSMITTSPRRRLATSTCLT